MNTTRATLLCLLTFAAASSAAEDHKALSIVTARPMRSGEVIATGRLVPMYRTLIGSRLAAHIVDWGKNDDGQPLDVGMAVKAGQKLFAIDPSTFQAQVDSARARLASAEAALENLRAPTRKERLDVLRAAIAELDARIKDRQRDEERFRRLVEVDQTMPVKRLEEVQLELDLLKTQRTAAQARLDEALAGPTRTEIALAEAQVKEAQTLLASAELNLRDTVIVAPFDAVITRRMKSLGDYVAGAPFVEVLELTTVDRLEAELSLPEAYAPYVTAGDTRLTLRSPLLDRDLPLTVSRVIPEIDARQGTFAFRVAIPPERRGGLVPGTFVTAVMALDNRTESVILPQKAVLVDSDTASVMVAAEGKMVRRRVELGDRLTEGVIVKSGLKPGENIVVGPPELLKDGAPLPKYLLMEKK